MCGSIAIACALFLWLVMDSPFGGVFGWGVFVVVAICELGWSAGAGLALFLAAIAAIRGARHCELLPAVITAVVALALTIGYVAYLLNGPSLLGG